MQLSQPFLFLFVTTWRAEPKEALYFMILLEIWPVHGLNKNLQKTQVQLLFPHLEEKIKDFL